MEIQRVPEGVHADDQPGVRNGLVEQDTASVDQHLGRHPAQLAEQLPVRAELRAQHLGEPQRDLAVANGKCTVECCHSAKTTARLLRREVQEYRRLQE